MYVKTCFLTILYLNYLKCDDVFFLVNQYSPDKYFCVTNSSNALSWVLPDTTQSFNQVSDFIPNQTKNTWKLKCIYPPSSKIKCKQSLTKQVIFDRRWEELTTYTTDYVENENQTNAPLNYITPRIGNIPKSEFDIPLSIRIEKEAHIFLCDGDNVTKSRCYWFLLQVYDGKTSTLRKCGNYKISSNKNVASLCSQDLTVTRPYSEFPSLLNAEIWTHFILSKSQNKLSLKKITDSEESILEYEDDKPYTVTHLFIHSKKVVGFWKIHEVEFFRTTTEQENIELSDINVINGSICVSLFIKTCPICKIKLELKTSNEIIASETFQGKPYWHEIIYKANDIKISEGKLTLSTLTDGSNNQINTYWSFGSFKYCHKDGFRMIVSDQTANCQLISNRSKILNISGNIPNSTGNDNCAENTVTSFCIPCSWFANTPHCGKLKICDEEKCKCSAGYKTPLTSTKCSEECVRGFYGHNCRNKCGKCENHNCNEVDGTCQSKCIDNYTGSKCDIAPHPQFKSPPTVINVSYETVDILVNNFETINSDQSPETFMIQYKLADSSWNWSTAEENLRFNEDITIKIKELKPGHSYFVRCVVTTPTPRNNFSSEDNVQGTRFTTKCDEITEKDIGISASDSWADVKYPDKPTLCYYKISKTETYSEYQRTPTTVLERQTKIRNLKPFTKYTVFMHLDPSKKVLTTRFQTTEGIPGAVKNLKSKQISRNEVLLEWQKPESPNGVIQNYTVKYKVVSHKSCKNQNNLNSFDTKIITKETSRTIGKLTPYSTYTFSVFAKNNAFQGEPTTVTQDLDASDVINKDEIPRIESIEPNTRSVNIKFSPISCIKINGPLFMKFTANCFTDGCANNKTYSLNFIDTTFKRLSGLSPFTKYTLLMKFCRNDQLCRENEDKKNFETPPETPYTVQDLLVYSKNDHSISLRWKPPHPPTGTLNLYKIEYSLSSTHDKKIFNISSTYNCELWPKYQCYTIDNLSKNTDYSVKVLAKNKETDFGQTAYMRAKTIIEQPGPPPSISLSWTLYNELEISWKHPIIANGDIRFFNISVIPHEQDIGSVFHNLDVTKPLRKYTIIANDTLPSTRYRVTVRAFNGYLGVPIITEDVSPPSIPTFTSKPEWLATNTTISLTIPPQNIENNNYTLFLLINDGNTNNHADLQTLKTKFKTDLSMFAILYHCQLQDKKELQLSIGRNISENNINCTVNSRKFLSPETPYNFTFLLKNTDSNNNSSYSLLSYIIKTSGKAAKNTNQNLLALLTLLLIIPVAVLLFVKRRSLLHICAKTSVPPQNEENGTLLANRPKILNFRKNAKTHSKVVPVPELEEYVKKSLENGELERQHNLLPRGQTKPWEYGALPANKSKNRYTNLVAYDHTRVVLQKIDRKEYSDYINANFIDGYNVQRAYIATQGPKLSTVLDFWRMIWQENVIHIAMLANVYEGGKKKVEKYWPDNNNSMSFGEITVKNASTEVHTDFEHRIFQVIHKNMTRLVHQYHFSSWPDHGVPLYSQSLIPFLRTLQNINLDSKSPIVVHCSAGVGRTGTIILCDTCLRMAANENAVDVLRTFQLLRDQRPNMVDNIQQYKLAHLVILEYLTGIETGIPCNEIERKVQRLIECEEVSKQMRYLEETAWQVDIMKSVAQKNKNFLIVEAKNRFQTIIPELQGCIFLSPYPYGDESSTYINAVTVDGFRSPGRFIVTQQPMPNTIGDFWRLISQKEISVIISLNEIDTKNKTCCSFWPTKNKPELKPVSFMTLKHVKTLPLDAYNVITIHMHIDDEEEFKAIEILSYKQWPAQASCPESIEDFLTFWEESNSTSRHSNSVLVTCFDGALASGLYVALSFVIEKMKLEQICDVCQAVRTVRHNRRQFVTNEEQFTFLYRAAVMYINGFQSYANFN